MTTRSKIKVFDLFTKALVSLETHDKILYSWPRNRLALAHALAVHLQEQLGKPTTYSVDLCPVLSRSKRTFNPDILVHNRQSGHQLLSIVCKNDYLTETEQKELASIKDISCDYVTALSFMPQKSYILVYVANENGIEYYHFDRNLLIMEPIRKRTTNKPEVSSKQLTLEKILKKKNNGN